MELKLEKPKPFYLPKNNSVQQYQLDLIKEAFSRKFLPSGNIMVVSSGIGKFLNNIQNR